MVGWHNECYMLGMETNPNKETAMKVYTVKSNGKMIRTMDNPLNWWVRSIDDGKFYPVDHK